MKAIQNVHTNTQHGPEECLVLFLSSEESEWLHRHLEPSMFDDVTEKEFIQDLKAELHVATLTKEHHAPSN